MERQIQIKIAELWGEKIFSKSNWGNINVFVGPNGTGKTLFSNQLKDKLNSIFGNQKVRYLNAERLSGFEKRNYGNFSSSELDRGLNIGRFDSYKSSGAEFGLATDGFIRLKQRLDIKIKIEALLSDVFKKTIRLDEQAGFLKPKMYNINRSEYDLKENECHGLKELISLLTFLYNPDYNCIIIDEPELHLHPQFQSYIIQEIRNMAGDPITNPGKKIFFLITHSPYFIDLQNLDDLKNVIVFHKDKIPSYIDSFNSDDEYRLKPLLSRFNTHHKQFFFSSSPIFVEGYSDFNIFSYLYEKVGMNLGALGACIIEVGGKDELEVFFRICRKVDIDAKFITDYDAILRGKLRETISNNQKSVEYCQKLGFDLKRDLIGDIEVKLRNFAQKLIDLKSKMVLPDYIQKLEDTTDNSKLHDLRKTILHILIHKSDEIEKILPQFKGDIDLIIGKYNQIIKAFEICNIFILPRGELEDYYIKTSSGDKYKRFDVEREYILNITNRDEINQQYQDLFEILKKAIPNIDINYKRHLKFQLIEWIQSIQLAVEKKEIKNGEELMKNSNINYNLFKQILELKEFNLNEDNKQFTSKIKINKLLSSSELEISFNESTTASNFDF